MRQVKNILYVLNDKTVLSFHNEDIVVVSFSEDGSSNKSYVPVKNVEMIVVFGDISISTQVLKGCADNGIVLSFVSFYGNYYARVFGKIRGNIHLRKKQYELYENESFRLSIVKNMIFGKIGNSVSVLSYFANSRNLNFDDEIDFLKSQMCIVNFVDSIEALRGIEAVSAASYYSAFDRILSGVDEDMLFVNRSRRPPENYCNALLSFLYTMLNLNCIAALESFGLDSYLGYMHSLRPGRESLANDLIEEFRSPFVDRFVLSLINLREVVSSDFVEDGSGIFLTKDGRKKVLFLWEKEKTKLVYYPLLNKKVEKRLVPYLQAQYLADVIRGRVSEYPVWFWDWRK